jgi:spermidine synthase
MNALGMVMRSDTGSDKEKVHRLRTLHWWYVLFFISGFPALLYQIVWQRSLFAIYGVNIESVTIVVTTFMLGLGLGSLAGGVLSKRQNFPLLPAFGIIELGIGLFGIVSLKIFHWASLFSAGSAPLETGMMAFGLVLVPTMLMGSTLPMLVAHTVRINSNVGASVGVLYAVNTLGSAIACFAAGMFIMWQLGESGSVRLAASLNAAVGALVLFWYWRKRYSKVEAPSRQVTQDRESIAANVVQSPTINFAVAMILAGVSGTIALAYEILWYRLFSYVTGSWAKSFAYLLGAYLAGIGLGSLASERLCERRRTALTFLSFVAWFVLLANVIGFLVAPTLAEVARHADFMWALPLVTVAAGFLGIIFPLLCHISVAPDARAGERLSYLYLSNIIGSAVGSYAVGFVLMNYLSTTQIGMILALSGIALATAILFAAKLDERKRVYGLAAVALCTLLISLGAPTLFGHLYEKMLFKRYYQPEFSFKYSNETRSGVVNVRDDGVVYGGGIYDGVFNTGLLQDRNFVIRAYAVAAFHPNPQDVLMIGLSSGSWAQVIAHLPSVRSMTIVEINGGYLPIIAKYPQVSSLLHNPKVRIIIDDGRRWLLRNPHTQFDVVVMNTTYNWRAHTTNLLSRDFLELVRPHLKRGGQLYYNTTGASEVFATGLSVYPYGLRVGNFLLVSDSKIVVDKERWRRILSDYQIDSIPLFVLSNPSHVQRLNKVLSLCDTFGENSRDFELESEETLRARTSQARIITDDNMGTEWDPRVRGTTDFR